METLVKWPVVWFPILVVLSYNLAKILAAILLYMKFGKLQVKFSFWLLWTISISLGLYHFSAFTSVFGLEDAELFSNRSAVFKVSYAIGLLAAAYVISKIAIEAVMSLLALIQSPSKEIGTNEPSDRNTLGKQGIVICVLLYVCYKIWQNW